MVYLVFISAFFVAIPTYAIWKWQRRYDRPPFPLFRIACCWLIPVFFIVYALFGPFYTVVEPSISTNVSEGFELLAKEQLPIKLVLFGGFFAQFFIIGRLLIKSPEDYGLLVFSFGLLAVYCSVFALLFAADSLFGGLG